MHVISVTNPRWANAEQTAIDCDLVLDSYPDQVLPFTATPHDVEDHGREVFARAASGEFGPVAAYVAPPPPPAPPAPSREQQIAALQAQVQAIAAQLAALNEAQP